MRQLIAILAVLVALVGNVTAQDRQSKYDHFFLEAVMQKEKGNNDAAFDLFKHCISIDSTKPEAHYFLGKLYYALKDKEKSQACFEKAVALNPDNTTYLETLAFSYVQSARLEDATTMFERLYENAPGQTEVLNTLVRLYLQQENYDAAVKTLDKIENVEGKSERLAYTKSEIFTMQGKHDAAIEEIKKLADQYPNDLNYRGLYGDALLMNGKEQEALDIFKEILKEEPDNMRAQMSMLTYHKREGDTLVADSLTRSILLNKNTTLEDRVGLLRQEIAASEEAGGDSTKILGYFEQLMKMPDVSTDLVMLYVSYMSMKKMPRQNLESVLEKVVQMMPDYAGARLQLVQYAWDDKNWERVIALCQAARQYTPDLMEFYYYQGIAYSLNDDTDKALDALQNGIGVITQESSPELVSDFYSIMGDLMHQKGMNKEAYAAYDSCLQWKPDNIGCLNNYAYFLSEDGKHLEKAEEMSYKTVQAEPENPTYLDTYAWILFVQKRYSEAKVYIDQALKHDKDTVSGVIIEHAGDIYAMNGDKEKALELWKKAAEREPDNKILARKIKLKKYIKE